MDYKFSDQTAISLAAGIQRLPINEESENRPNIILGKECMSEVSLEGLVYVLNNAQKRANIDYHELDIKNLVEKSNEFWT